MIPSFKLFFEEFKLKKVRQVKKAFNKLYKKGKMDKFSPNTFGFDIEFNYNRQDEEERLQTIVDAIKKSPQKLEEFENWKSDLPEDELDNDDMLLTRFANFIILNKKIYDLEIPESTNKLREYKELLKSLGQSVKYNNEDFNFDKDWVLSLDTEGQPEISSKILTTKDLGLVKQLLNLVKDEKTSHDCSAHIHIGLPKYFDSFAVLALFSLVDEHTIQIRQRNRPFDSVAQLAKDTVDRIKDIISPIINKKEDIYVVKNKITGKEKILREKEAQKVNYKTYKIFVKNNKVYGTESKKLFNKLKKALRNNDAELIYEKDLISNRGDDFFIKSLVINWLNPDFQNYEVSKYETINGDIELNDKTLVVNRKIFNSIIETVTNKFSGINLVYYKSRRVIEFRYLSSEILQNINEFLQFINYFLYIVYVANKAKRVKFNDFTLRKLDNGKIQIELTD